MVGTELVMELGGASMPAGCNGGRGGGGPESDVGGYKIRQSNSDKVLKLVPTIYKLYFTELSLFILCRFLILLQYFLKLGSDWKISQYNLTVPPENQESSGLCPLLSLLMFST